MSSDLKTFVRKALKRHSIYMTVEEVEQYLRVRVDNLSPLARSTIFHIALNQPKGVLEDSQYREDIYEDILSSFKKKNVKDTFLDLWIAGVNALPESIRTVVLSVAFSESGSTGSPERALVTLFKNMGPLMQKLGQSLAFDPNLNESFRKELEKLWDEAQELSWWKAWELIRVQYGDIESQGYRLTRIMNSGSTEATLEIENQLTKQKFVLSVYRDGIKRGVSTDSTDLRKFVNYLIEINPRRYGHLKLLVEDSLETIGPELNRDHKRKANIAMTEIYEDTISVMGGEKIGEGVLVLGDYKVIIPKYVSLNFEGGKSIYAQELATGEPLKELRDKDPEEYRRVSKFIIEIENQAIKRGEWVDKDRMPGQYLYDRKSRTIYFLDQGQGRKIDSRIHSQFEAFMGLLYSGSILKALELFSNLFNFEFSQEYQAEFKQNILNTDTEMRPLHALNFLSSHFMSLNSTDESRIYFFDLVHAVRGKLRLAHWEASLNLDIVRRDIRKSVQRHLTWESLPEMAKLIKTKAINIFHNWFPSFLRENSGEETIDDDRDNQLPETVSYDDIERMDEPFQGVSFQESLRRIQKRNSGGTSCTEILSPHEVL